MKNRSRSNTGHIYDIDAREISRRKNRFRTSPVLSDSPIAIYLDYLYPERTFAPDKVSTAKSAKRYRPIRDFSKIEDNLKTLNTKKLKTDLEEYIETLPSWLFSKIENLFTTPDHFNISNEDIQIFCGISPPEAIHKEEDYIVKQTSTKWLPMFERCLCLMLESNNISDRAAKEQAAYMLGAISVEIQNRLAREQSDSHANELCLYTTIYLAMASKILSCAEAMLPYELLHIFLANYLFNLSTLDPDEDQEALGALLLASPKKAMHYYGSYLLFTEQHKLEVLANQIEVEKELLIVPDCILQENERQHFLEDERGFDSPLLKSLDMKKMETTKQFFKSTMGQMLHLSENSILDILSTYNFLFSTTDQLSFKNRSDKNKGYKLYSVQTYVQKLLGLESELTQSNGPIDSVQQQLKAKYKIEPNEEFLAAMRVFSLYRNCILELLHPASPSKGLIDEARLCSIRAIGASILFYDAQETIKANTLFLCASLSPLYDLIHYGEIRPLKLE